MSLAQKANTNKAADIFNRFGTYLILLLMVVVVSIVKPQFLNPTNIFNVLTQTSIFGILALGVTVIIISKGIDLSLGSMLAFAGVTSASLAQVVGATNKMYPQLAQMPIIVPIVVALVVGTLTGMVNGLLIAKTGIPPFIATLGTYTVVRGLALVYTNGKPVSDLLPGYQLIGGKMFNVIPVPVVIYAIVALVTFVLLNYTRLGKSAYALGANINAAEVAGIKIARSIVAIYSYAGLLCGVAAIVFAGRVGSVNPGAAVGYELTAIAATTIGGTSQSGGIGKVSGAIVGALILGVLNNALTLLGVDAYWQQIVQGSIIVGAVIIDMRKNSKRK